MQKENIEKKKLVVKNDIIFKEIFSKKGNEIFLQEFISSLIKTKVWKIEIAKEVELPIRNVEEKIGVLDIKALINEDTIINIEMQIARTGNMKKRAIFYACRLMSSQLKAKEKYENIKKVITVSILDYNIFKKKEYITKMLMTENTGRKKEKIEDLQLYFIELPKFREKVKEIKKLSVCAQWLVFIDGRDEEKMSVVVKENKKIRKAKEEVEYLTGKEAEKRWAELREKWDRDYSSGMYNSFERGVKSGIRSGIRRGRNVGRLEGKNESKIEIAKEMLKRNSDINFISEVTKLPIEEIKNLIKKIK